MASFGPAIYRAAMKYAKVRSRKWLFSTAKDDFKANTNKCNLFVHDVIVEAGVSPPPTVSKYLGLVRRRPTAQEWSDPEVTIDNWLVVQDPAPGDVVAIGFNDQARDGATGHVGIYGGNNTTISAHSGQAGRIVQNDWGFREGHRPTFRRCMLEAPSQQSDPRARKNAARTA